MFELSFWPMGDSAFLLLLVKLQRKSNMMSAAENFPP